MPSALPQEVARLGVLQGVSDFSVGIRQRLKSLDDGFLRGYDRARPTRREQVFFWGWLIAFIACSYAISEFVSLYLIPLQVLMLFALGALVRRWVDDELPGV